MTLTMPMTSASLVRVAVCDSQPPFDDELPDPTQPAPPLASGSAPTSASTAPAKQRALALAFAFPGGLPAIPDLPCGLHPVPSIGRPRTARIRAMADDEFGPQPTPRAQLPEPTPWAGRLVQGLLEVLSGVRPASQLVRWTTTEVYDSVQRRVAHTSIENRASQLRRRAEVVRSVHVSEPADGVAEICAIVGQGPRCRAVAMRLEGVDGRWQCTALQIG